MFAPPAYLFVYLYDRWEVRGLKIPLYILGWSTVATCVEWIMALGHVFTYKEWHISYSFVVYLFVQPLTLLVFEYVRRREIAWGKQK